MQFTEAQQQIPQQWALSNPQNAQIFGQPGLSGLGQAAFGQPQQWGQGQQYQQPYGATQASLGWNPPQAWGQQRQLTQQDIGEVVHQIVPFLSQILAQAQQAQHAQAAFGYTQHRQLSQQDVNEVVRQILPLVPQIVGAMQGQPQMQAAAVYGQPLQQTLQNPFNPFQQQNPFQQIYSLGAQQLQPQALAAYGQQGQQRQLSQQDVNEVVRQLCAVIPQVIGSLQATSQQRF